MFEPCVLGVDPGLAATGLAAVSETSGRAQVLWSETVRTPSGLAEAMRLRRLAEAVRDAIATHRPQAMAVEAVMWGQNKTSALSVARATGVVLLAAAEAGIPVEEYAPLEVKMAITGIGNAEKDRVRAALIRAHRVAGVPEQADAADAVAVALCHLHQSRLRRAAQAAGGAGAR
jgi:crossover junction endodeoxyribonuclease RuvC